MHICNTQLKDVSSYYSTTTATRQPSYPKLQEDEAIHKQYRVKQKCFINVIVSGGTELN